MALITISDVDLPTPTGLQVGYFDISKAERNANGRMIIERVTTKRKLFISYDYLTENNAEKILKMIAPTFYNVVYLDPQSNTLQSGSFYCGDRNIEFIDYHNGVARYKSFSFNLIER